MIEININPLKGQQPISFAASAAEIGQDAGKKTWANAMAAGDILGETSLYDIRDCLRGFGAWDDEELALMNRQALNALVIQFISGSWRECFGDWPFENPTEDMWVMYRRDWENGRVTGDFWYDKEKKELFSGLY